MTFRLSLTCCIALVACTGNEFDPNSIKDGDLIGDEVDPQDTSTIDTAGEPFVRERPWDCFGMVEIDDDEDGEPEAVRYNIYDIDNRDQRIRYEYDVRDDALLEAFGDYEYDANGNLTLREGDFSGSDGLLDERETWAYNEDSLELSYTLDEGADGTLEFVRERTYDENGFPATRNEDTDGDGIFDVRRTYTTDKDGVIRTYVDDIDNDGVPDIAYITDYDEQGRTLLSEGRDIKTKELTYRWAGTFTPDKSEKGAERWLAEIDEDGDGTPEILYDYIYAEDGTIRQARQDLDGDGIFERNWYDMVYDDADRASSWRYLFVDAADLDEFEFDLRWEYYDATSSWVTRYEQALESRNAAGAVLGTGLTIETTTYTCPNPT